MTQLRTDILIAMKADTSGANAARDSLFAIQGAASRLNAAFALGGAALGAAGLASFVRRGVEFNSTVESAQIGVASLLLQFRPEKFTNFADALTASKQAVAELKKEAATSPATFRELVQSLQSTAGAAFAAGIPLEKQIGLINRISQAAATLGLKGDQIPQEARALFSGDINADAQLAKSLGITSADITAAKSSAGGLFDFLNGKLASFAKAAPFAAGTLTQQASNLADTLDDLAGRLAGPLTDKLKAGMKELNTAVAGLTDAEIKDIADALARAAEGAIALAKGLIAAAPAAKEIALAAAALVLASRAFNASRTVGALAEGITAGRAASAAARRSGPDPTLFAAFDAEVKNSLNSLSGFATALSKGVAVSSALFAGWEAGAAIDRATGFSSAVADTFAPGDAERKLAKGRAIAPEEVLQVQTSRLLRALAANDKAAFDATAKSSRADIASLRTGRFADDSELQPQVDAFEKALASFTKRFAQKFSEASASASASKAAADAAAALERARRDRERRLRVANALADREPDPVSQAKAKARAAIGALVDDPQKGASLRKLGLNTAGDPAEVLARAEANARRKLNLTTLAPRKFSDAEKDSAIADFEKISALNAPVQDAVKRRAEEMAAASKKLEDSLKSLGETDAETAVRHLSEALAALGKTAPGTLANIEARQAVVVAQTALDNTAPKAAALKPFTPAVFADSLTAFGGSLSAPPISAGAGGGGGQPAALDAAKSTADSSRRMAELLKEIAANTRRTGSTTTAWN